MKKGKSENWLELAQSACEDAGIECGSINLLTAWDQTFSHSSNYRNNAVFQLGNQQILKLYGPTSERQFHVERSTLQMLAKQSKVPAPRFVTAKERDHLPHYLIMSEMTGATLQDSWENLTRSEQLAIAHEIGKITAATQQLPQNSLAQVEQKLGSRNDDYIQAMQVDRLTDIESSDTLSVRQQNELRDFLFGEARELLNEPPVFTHSDLSHAHIYLAQEAGTWCVSGFIDWAEAMLGPPEWDIAFHWFWTYTWDVEAMQACLKGLYPHGQLPERFARRCFGTHLYSYSMSELWPYFEKQVQDRDSIVREMTAFFFPPNVFGSPD